MMHRRIIFDFDDTIAFTKNRDWDNAKPNYELIQKINNLYDSGNWVIDIFTARGSISCKTRKEADEKYRASIESWLAKHSVKYHNLSFEKPLAAYYVDDKGITPTQFIETDFRELEGGLSGSDIYTDGMVVYKKDANAHIVRDWYETVQDCLNVPTIRTVIGDVISMDYIPHNEKFFVERLPIALGLIQESLRSMNQCEVKQQYTFDTYIERIKKHVDLADVMLFKNVLRNLERINLAQSFSHGDFGIKNMLFNEKELQLYLIDPIPNMFGCYQLDVAKFIASLLINKHNPDIIFKSIKVMISYNYIDTYILRTLVQSEIIRVYKYHPDKNFIMNCVEECVRVFEQI